jgi:hypothetical protein
MLGLHQLCHTEAGGGSRQGAGPRSNEVSMKRVGFTLESRQCLRLSPRCVSASIVLKVTIFDQNGLKTLSGDLSRLQAVETKMPSVEDTLPRAGYPTVPECRDSTSDGPR